MADVVRGPRTRQEHGGVGEVLRGAGIASPRSHPPQAASSVWLPSQPSLSTISNLMRCRIDGTEVKTN